jgi:hypothetical protein
MREPAETGAAKGVDEHRHFDEIELESHRSYATFLKALLPCVRATMVKVGVAISRSRPLGSPRR